MRMVTCDFCGKGESVKINGNSSIKRIFFSDICFDCYQKIREEYIAEGGDLD